MAHTFKLLMTRAPVGPLIGYFTDAQQLWGKNVDWVINNDYNLGPDFANEVVEAPTAVLETDAIRSRERAQAVEATVAQKESFTAGAESVRKVRRLCNLIIDKLKEENTKESRKLARQVKSDMGTGKRVNLQRPNGIRRMLATQSSGLENLRPHLGDWPALLALLPELKENIEAIEEAIKIQSDEQIEADSAQDALEEVIASAIKTLNYAIKMVNVDHKQVPDDLIVGLQRLQSNHPKVFYSKKDIKELSKSE